MKVWERIIETVGSSRGLLLRRVMACRSMYAWVVHTSPEYLSIFVTGASMCAMAILACNLTCTCRFLSLNLPLQGVSTDDEQEMPAVGTLRGRVALVTCKCPRTFPRDPAVRKAQGTRIPADLDKQSFLKAFRQTLGAQCNQKVISASCHAQPHTRRRRSTHVCETKYRLALRMDQYFP